MANSGNAQKRLAWESRFARFRTSGLSVTRFCEQERVSSKVFYYWAKRLRPTAATKTRWADRPLPRRRASASLGMDLNTQGAMVRFRWNNGMEVSVPAQCLDVIRCLAQCLAQADVRHGESFQEVVVKV